MTDIAMSMAQEQIKELRAEVEQLTALLKETRSHVLDAGAAGLVADIDRALEPKP